MQIIPFEELYYTDFKITESFVKPHNWFERGNNYSCLGKPKPSHTLLWFKNCRGRLTSKDGAVMDIEKNQLLYTTKGVEYSIDFIDTAPEQVDTIVFHFQMHTQNGEELTPATKPVICIKEIDPSTAVAMELAAEEYKKNIVCVAEITSVIYLLFAKICKRQRNRIVKKKYNYIRTGIEMLENDSEKSMEEIAQACGVSEGYFRKLFREYSGDNPMEFRQKHRVEKAKQLLVLDNLSVSQIAHELGFSDIYHFSKTFKKYSGMSPLEYVKKAKDTSFTE